MSVNNVNNNKSDSDVALVVNAGISLITDIIKRGVYLLTVKPSDTQISMGGVVDNSAVFLSSNDIFINNNDQKFWISSTKDSTIYFQATDSDISPATISTLETISATGTYTQTGSAKVLVIGGGQGGRATVAPAPGQPTGTAVAGSGGRVAFSNNVTLPGSVPVVIGAGGPAPGNDGGDTSFGTLTSAGGVRAVGTVGPGTPGETILGPTGFLQYLSPIDGGVAYTSPTSSAIASVMNGGIAAAGGGTAITGTTVSSGAGGGGVVGPVSPSGVRVGGAGRVYLVRFP